WPECSTTVSRSTFPRKERTPAPTPRTPAQPVRPPVGQDRLDLSALVARTAQRRDPPREATGLVRGLPESRARSISTPPTPPPCRHCRAWGRSPPRRSSATDRPSPSPPSTICCWSKASDRRPSKASKTLSPSDEAGTGRRQPSSRELSRIPAWCAPAWDWVTAKARLWPGSVRLLVCAAGLWTTALIAPGAWALACAPVLVVLGFALLTRRHHLGVGLILFACLFTIQITALTVSRGPESADETGGTVVGHSDPGTTGWTRLTLLTPTGFTEVLSPAAVDAGTTVSMATERLDVIGLSSAAPDAVGRPNGRWRGRESRRTRLRAVSLAAGNDGGDLLPGLVVGDTAPQDARMIDDMRVVSLTHISAVSGSNVTIVSLGAGLVAGVCRAGPRLRVGIGVLTCLGYVFIVGFEPSAIRAAGMAIAAAVVFLRGGGISPVAVLCATASLLLAFVPVLATSVGFVLSVVSTTAIMFVVPILLRRLAVHLPLLPSVLVAALIVPFVAQLACTPVLVAIDPRIGLWSVAANALAAPAVLPATVAGFLSLVCQAIATTGLPGPDIVAGGLAWFGSLPAWWIDGVARGCASLPGASLDWPTPPVGTVLAAALLAVAVGGTWMLVRRHLWGLPVIVLCLVLTASVIIGVRARPPGADWLALVCDVGQGSGAVINLGQGRGLVIDTGEETKPIDTCLDDSGIEEFDLLISHFDADHFAGYAGTTWGRRLDRMFVSVNAAESHEARRVATDTGAEVV